MSRASLDIAARVHTISRNSFARLRLERIRTRAREHAAAFLAPVTGDNERRVCAQELLDAARQLHARECGTVATECREAAGAGAR